MEAYNDYNEDSIIMFLKLTFHIFVKEFLLCYCIQMCILYFKFILYIYLSV